MKELLDKALKYHRLGWCVIIIPYGKKKPIIKWGKYQKAQPDERTIRQWFSGNEANIAVMLGQISGGLTCLDFDTMEGYEQWKQAKPELAAMLPTAQTSRGMHIYFLSKLKKTKKMKKLDIKASGYCILPPSLHPDGKTIYSWLIHPNGNIPELTLSDLGIVDFTEEADETKERDAIASPSLQSLPSSLSLPSSPSSVKSMDMEKIVFEKLDEKTQHYVNTAIKCTLPSKSGYRNFLIFQYCRWLKGHAEFEKLAAWQLKSLVRSWYERALSFIATQEFDVTWADFAYGWSRVRYPKGNGALKIATETALNAKDTIFAEEMYVKPEIRLLVRICFELQKLQGREPFWLSWNDGAWILGVSTPTAGKWLCMLEEDMVIQKIEEHTHIKATRYKFIEIRKKYC